MMLDEPASVMRYVDAARRVEKAARIDDGVMTAFCLSGETAAAEWLKGMMIGRASLEAVRPWLLAPVATPPRGSVARGRIVCNCLDVAEADIMQAITNGAGLDQLQSELHCGTSCGSCVPELRRMVQAGAGKPSGNPQPAVATAPLKETA